MELMDVLTGLRTIRKSVDAHYIWGLLHFGPICNECFEETLKHHIDTELNSDAAIAEHEVDLLISKNSWW